MDDVVLLATDQSHALAAARLCNFPTGHANLLPAHISWLDKTVAPLLRGLPNPWVDLFGYASHLGNHAFNKRLSFDRCEAVHRQINSYGLNVSFPQEFGAGDDQSTGTATDNSGAWRAVEIYVYGARPPP
jgi:outer membrane protein OmpA-like peptidoglycan-associated protein